MLNVEYPPKLSEPTGTALADFDTWLERLVDSLRSGEFEIRVLNVTTQATIYNYSLGQIGSWSVSENTITNATIVLDAAQNRITVDTIVLDGAENEIRIGGSQVKLDADAQVISINSGTWGAQGIQLDYNSGTPRAYIGDGANQYFKFDGTNVSWKGTNTSLTAAGAFTASNATITGSITASTGTIGGFTIGASTLSAGTTHIILDSSNKKISINDATYGNSGIQLDYNSGTPRIYVGDGSNQYLKYDGTSASLKIGTILIDGDNTRIRSTNYVTGYAGAGFTLEPGLLEVGNIAARGIIRTAVFQKDVAHVVGGNLLVRPADVLSTDMTAADASTLTIEGNETFSVGDFLRIKDGTDDEWLEVTNAGSAPTYTVTRDRESSYNSDANPAWTKGASVINYGASGEGGVFISSSETNAPYLTIYSHTGSPWSDIGRKVQIGNLNGFLGYASELYGLAAGNETQYFKYDPTNGVRVPGTVDIIGASTFKGQISVTSTGSIRSNTTGNYPYLEFSNSGLQLKTSDTGGTYGTATYTTAATYGFGATVWLMNSHYQIPWFEPKEPTDGSNDMPSLRLYNRGADPAGGTYATGDLAVVGGKLKIYTSGAWTVVGTQS